MKAEVYGEIMEFVDTSKYWVLFFSGAGGYQEDGKTRLGEGLKNFGMIGKMRNARCVSLGVKRKLYEGKMVPVGTY